MKLTKLMEAPKKPVGDRDVQVSWFTTVMRVANQVHGNMKFVDDYGRMKSNISNDTAYSFVLNSIEPAKKLVVELEKLAEKLKSHGARDIPLS